MNKIDKAIWKMLGGRMKLGKVMLFKRALTEPNNIIKRISNETGLSEKEIIDYLNRWSSY